MAGVLPVETLADRGPWTAPASPAAATARTPASCSSATPVRCRAPSSSCATPCAPGRVRRRSCSRTVPSPGALREPGAEGSPRRGAAPTLSGLRRDASPLRALPMLGRLAGLALELARAARACDVVYANSQKAFLLAALPARLVGRPLIWHLHDILDGAHFGRAQRLVQARLANACAARVVVPSQAAADAFVQRRRAAALVTVVPNGLDLTATPAPPPRCGPNSACPRVPCRRVQPSRALERAGRRARGAGRAARRPVHRGRRGPVRRGRLRRAPARPRGGARSSPTGCCSSGQRGDVPRLMQAVDAVVHPRSTPSRSAGPSSRRCWPACRSSPPMRGPPARSSTAARSAPSCRRGDPTASPPPSPRLFDAPDAFARAPACARERALARYGAARMQRRPRRPHPPGRRPRVTRPAIPCHSGAAEPR